MHSEWKNNRIRITFFFFSSNFSKSKIRETGIISNWGITRKTCSIIKIYTTILTASITIIGIYRIWYRSYISRSLKLINNLKRYFRITLWSISSSRSYIIFCIFVVFKYIIIFIIWYICYIFLSSRVTIRMCNISNLFYLREKSGSYSIHF